MANGLFTAITVSHNTKELLQRAYESVRKFHNFASIIIFDNSDDGDPCREYAQHLPDKDSNVMTLCNRGNCGHGPAMACVLDKYCKTPFALMFDTDIEVIKSPVYDMINMMDSDTYGVGYLEPVDFGGFVYGIRPEESKRPPIPYLHPFFQVIQVSQYKKYSPYIHHGSPCIKAMLDIWRAGLSWKILKEFPGLGPEVKYGEINWNVPAKYVKHDCAGTRSVRKNKGLPEIEGLWQAV